jgi:hypothetical protein
MAAERDMADTLIPEQDRQLSPAANGAIPTSSSAGQREAHRGVTRINGAVSGVAGANPHAQTALAAIMRSSATGLSFSSRMPYEIWSILGPRIAARANTSRWWLGDWLVFGERRYGTRYREAVAATGLDYQTLRNYAVVARRFELSRRRDNLSFQHHAEVCALPEAQQERWLDLANQNHWSKQELRLRIRRMKRMEQDHNHPHTLRFTVDDEHEELWREAAARCHCGFEDWVIRSLDAAATSPDGPTV